MQITLLTHGAFAFVLAGLMATPLAVASERFQGTYAAGPYVLRLHQVGTRVCGEWDLVTESQNREGLVAGFVADGVLTLTQCSDFELTCRPSSSDLDSAPMRLTSRGGNLERVGGNGDGSNQVFARRSGAKPKWSNAHASEVQQFLSSCNWK